MRNVRFAGLFVLSVALAACDTTPKDVVGPAPGAPLLSEAGGEDGTPLLIDEQRTAAEEPSAQQAATGGMASGHVDVAFTPVVDHRYSFTALSISPPPPFAAKGNVDFHITFPGGQSVGKGDVLCMTIVGNRARIAALWTDFRVNNVKTPIPPGQNLLWTVEDNGEGANDPPDRASVMFQGTAAQGLFHCATGFILPLMPNNNGNVQVKPE
jgi:hypothetical protein